MAASPTLFKRSTVGHLDSPEHASVRMIASMVARRRSASLGTAADTAACTTRNDPTNTTPKHTRSSFDEALELNRRRVRALHFASTGAFAVCSSVDSLLDSAARLGFFVGRPRATSLERKR